MTTLMVRLWELRSGRERLAISFRPTPLHFDPTGIAVAPDNRLVVVARVDGRLQFFDTATGQELPGRAGFDTPASYLAFRPDGQTLATGHRDGTVLIWDAPRLPRPSLTRLDAAVLEARWADLAGEDGRKAHTALWDLVAVPAQAVELFVARLRPAEAVPAERLRQRIAELNHEQFRVRQNAERELARDPDQAELILRAVLLGNLSAEQRQRVEAILNASPAPLTPEALRSLRAVEVLERIGTAEARRVLERLAGGAPAARLTREAKASLDRLGRTAVRP
jgi:hypothetical protein